MSTSLNEYQKKRALLEQLQKEIEDVESDPAFAEQLRFIEAIDEVLTRFNKRREALAALLPAKVSAPPPAEKATRRRRRATLRVFEHPETGQRVEAKSMNHKTLRRWVEEHGKATVEGWVVEEG